jgi:hypothetical protein
MDVFPCPRLGLAIVSVTVGVSVTLSCSAGSRWWDMKSDLATHIADLGEADGGR